MRPSDPPAANAARSSLPEGVPMNPSQYPSHCLGNTLLSLSPHTPRGLLVRKPCAWATGSQTSKPSHPCPSRCGWVEMGPMEPAL
jgi:hypothetical protein